jgi:hypothetical protein
MSGSRNITKEALVGEDQPKREYKEFDMSIIRSGGGDFADYVQLPSEEPLTAYVSKIKTGLKKNKDGEEEDRVFIWATVVGGEGDGQEYRNDFAPSLDKKANLQKFLTAVYGSAQSAIDVDDLLGRPVRIELGEPWGDKGLQFIKTFKKPTPAQQRVDLVHQAEQTPESTMSAEEVSAMFDTEDPSV